MGCLGGCGGGGRGGFGRGGGGGEIQEPTSPAADKSVPLEIVPPIWPCPRGLSIENPTRLTSRRGSPHQGLLTPDPPVGGNEHVFAGLAVPLDRENRPIGGEHDDPMGHGDGHEGPVVIR